MGPPDRVALDEAIELAVEMRDVSRCFVSAGAVTRALDEVSMVSGWSKVTVVAGASGSGKSTLLSLIAAVDRPDSGEVIVGGRDLAMSRRARRRARASLVTMVLPQPSDNLFDHLDAAGNLRWCARDEAVDVADALGQVGLADRAFHAVRQLSGGEQQRLAIACALAAGTPVIVADEPTASLDRRSAASVIDGLALAAGAGRCVVVATHDPDVIAAADQVVWLDHGRRVA